MQIQNQTTIVDTAANAAAADTQQQKSQETSGAAALANGNTFLQLMVAQLKNQDPLQPADSVQFLTQLAQFSQLEQLIGIRQDIGALQPAAERAATQ